MEIILKGERGTLIKINLGKIKITKEGKLKMGRNVESVERKGISDLSVQASRKTRNSRALWGEFGWN